MTKRFIIVLIIILTIFMTFTIYKKNEYSDNLRNAIIKVKIKEDRTIPFNSKVKVSSFVDNLNGKIIEDYELKTNKIGRKRINFTYKNEDNLTIPYSYEINVVDINKPVIWLNSSYYVNTNFKGDLVDKIMCIDDTDDSPICRIEGYYDTKKVGSYNLTFIARDSSGNESRKNFTLYVSKPKKSSSSNIAPKRTKIEDAIRRYKNSDTKIGIDISAWQGDIDFNKVKNSGVEFVMIRVGSKKGSKGDYFIDSKFEQNIKGFNDVNIPVGIYFYSYASNPKEAHNDALWIIDKIKNYKVDLPIVFDWENWSNYNQYKMSLYTLNSTAEMFLKTIKTNGYDAMHYSSKNYLDTIWDIPNYPTWLAHYTTYTNYDKDYYMWQFCNNGKVEGINGNVDLNVMYINKEDVNE